MASVDRSRPLATLPFSASQQECLAKARFMTVGDVLDPSLYELAKELHVSRNEALEIRKVVSKTMIHSGLHSYSPLRTSESGGRDSESRSGSGTGSPAIVDVDVEATPEAVAAGVSAGESGLARLQREMSRTPILTFCNEFDVILGGGVQVGQTTEFCGWPGIGKTQLCKQLAVDVQIPAVSGGAEGAAIYIDTEGSFMVERVVGMCNEFISHMKRMTASRNEDQRTAAMNLTLEGLLSNMHYYRVTDFVEQVALVHILPRIIEERNKEAAANGGVRPIKLVVVDSVAFHFRHNFKDLALRTRLLSQMAQQLGDVAEKYDVAVVVTNQVTTRIVGEQSSFLQPALGDTWSHSVTNRVLLFWQEGQRFAHLLKSPAYPSRTAQYEITELGVRGALTLRPKPKTNPRPMEEAEAEEADVRPQLEQEQSGKRRREHEPHHGSTSVSVPVPVPMSQMHAQIEDRQPEVSMPPGM